MTEAQQKCSVCGNESSRGVVCSPTCAMRLPSSRDMSSAYVIDVDTECWVWKKAVSRSGYGVMSRFGIAFRAHRWFFEQHRGPIEPTEFIDHLCRNRRCVNPAHLDIVTKAVNCQRGAQAKLTTEDVNAMRRDAANGYNNSQLGRKYGVSRTSAWKAVCGKGWSNATEPPVTYARANGANK